MLSQAGKRACALLASLASLPHTFLLGSPCLPPLPLPRQEFHYLWTAPLEAAAILALLGYLTGDAMLPGLGVILLVLPLQYFFGYKIIQIKLQNAKYVAQRSSILQEVLPAIKLVKYYAWEQF